MQFRVTIGETDVKTTLKQLKFLIRSIKSDPTLIKYNKSKLPGLRSCYNFYHDYGKGIIYNSVYVSML
jgi:hypothetical protein